MSRIETAIEKFGLRTHTVLKCKNYAAGQKMDEDCIQKFVQGDPSGNGKYLEWMFYQAGGGKERLDRSILQWEKGEFQERPIREQLKEGWFKDETNGWTDAEGTKHPAISQEEAEAKWPEIEERWRMQHVYGDEDFSDVGFSFSQSWPGRNNLYERIVSAVQKFHKYQSKLRSMKVKLDLNLANYPQLKDLEDVVCNIWALEIKNDVDAECVFEDDVVVAMIPFNIGASLKYGIPKWCTSNDSNFSSVIQGSGICRWKEYSSKAVLVYCRLKGGHVAKGWQYVAIQVPFERIHCQDLGGNWSGTTFWDENDMSHGLNEFLNMASGGSPEVKKSLLALLRAVEAYCADFPFKRMVCDYIKKYKHLIPADVRKRAEERRLAQDEVPQAQEAAEPMMEGQQPVQAAG